MIEDNKIKQSEYKNVSNDTFLFENNSNRLLTAQKLTIDDLKKYTLLVFGDYRTAALSCNISYNRIRQILNGFDLPKTPKLINQISKGLNVNPIVLTILFSKKGEPSCMGSPTSCSKTMEVKE